MSSLPNPSANPKTIRQVTNIGIDSANIGVTNVATDHTSTDTNKTFLAPSRFAENEPSNCQNKMY